MQLAHTPDNGNESRDVSRALTFLRQSADYDITRRDIVSGGFSGGKSQRVFTATLLHPLHKPAGGE